MQASETRILTTHAGSLPRSRPLVELHARRSRGEAVDPDSLAKAVDDSMRNAVVRQLEAGIDIGNDGEQGRESFFTYLRWRMSGFGGESRRPVMRDLVRYPTFVELKLPEMTRGTQVSLMTAPRATGPVRYVDRGPLERECAVFRRLMGEHPRGFAQAFLTAPSPGIVAAAMEDGHYGDRAAYLADLADALRHEYAYIVEQGFVLQIDCPDLAMERHTAFADRPIEEFLAFVRDVLAAIERALAGVPRERVRLHVCWGNYEGPHDLDVPLAEILPALSTARVGALVLSQANPRHAHEHRLLAGLPRELAVVVGVIDTTTNYVEHPEVVAERIERAAAALGDPRRVIAGTDCGFETSAGFRGVAEEVAWAKLAALAEGAAIASRRLFAGGGAR